MTDRQYRSLARYIFKLAKDLGLGHMELSLHAEPPEGDHGLEAAASFEGTYGRQRGAIRVNKDFGHYSPVEQRHVIVHELIHAHTEHLREYVRTSLPGHLSQPAFQMFMSGYTQQDELFTDALADAIAPKFPLWDGK
jgi:hypothetical protein